MVACSLLMIARGVPFGTKNPFQLLYSYPGTPASSTVGSSGNSGERCFDEIASARKRPDLMCPTNAAAGAMHHCDSFAITAAAIGPPPLYGTCTELMPASVVNITPARWLDEPIPAEDMFSLPGCALASATSSFTVLAGNDGCATSTASAFTMLDTASKSFSTSKGRLL